MSAELRWEYCQLGFYGTEQRKEKRYYGLSIQYFGEDSRAQYLSYLNGDNAKPLSYNPWAYAFSFLGAASWELVNIQHSLMTGGSYGTGSGTLRWDDAVAYFKRPILSGRRIDEPKIMLPQK